MNYFHSILLIIGIITIAIFSQSDTLQNVEARSISSFDWKIDEKYHREGFVDFIVTKDSHNSLPVTVRSISDKPITLTLHTTSNFDQMGKAKLPRGIDAFFEPTEFRLEPNQSKQVELIINVDKNSPANLYDLQIVGTWKEEGKIPDFMGSSIRLHVGRDFGTQKIPVNMLSSPLKIWKESRNEDNFTINGIQCRNDYVLVIRSSNGNPTCVTLDTKIELTIRGWADDDRILLGCIGERVQKCYPEDKEDYRKALQHYYYESESEDNGTLSESDYDPHSPRCGSGVVPYIPKNWQATGKHPSDETWEALGNYLMKQEFYKELQQRNIVFEPACFGVYTGFAEESYPPRFAMCSIVTASNGTNIYLEGTIREFDVTFFDIDNKILYQCDDDHFGCLCVIENEN